MDNNKADIESGLTSPVVNALATSSKEEKIDSNDDTPTSSTDASTASTKTQIVSDDPISSTSSDNVEQIKEKIPTSPTTGKVDKESSEDHVTDLLAINVSQERITENVEDLVHDLESLLGESTDSFNFPLKHVKEAPNENASTENLGDGHHVLSNAGSPTATTGNTEEGVSHTDKKVLGETSQTAGLSFISFKNTGVVSERTDGTSDEKITSADDILFKEKTNDIIGEESSTRNVEKSVKVCDDKKQIDTLRDRDDKIQSETKTECIVVDVEICDVNKKDVEGTINIKNIVMSEIGRNNPPISESTENQIEFMTSDTINENMDVIERENNLKDILMTENSAADESTIANVEQASAEQIPVDVESSLPDNHREIETGDLNIEAAEVKKCKLVGYETETGECQSETACLSPDDADSDSSPIDNQPVLMYPELTDLEVSTKSIEISERDASKLVDVVPKDTDSKIPLEDTPTNRPSSLEDPEPEISKISVDVEISESEVTEPVTSERIADNVTESAQSTKHQYQSVITEEKDHVQPDHSSKLDDSNVTLKSENKQLDIEDISDDEETENKCGKQIDVNEASTGSEIIPDGDKSVCCDEVSKKAIAEVIIKDDYVGPSAGNSEECDISSSAEPLDVSETLKEPIVDHQVEVPLLESSSRTQVSTSIFKSSNKTEDQTGFQATAFIGVNTTDEVSNELIDTESDKNQIETKNPVDKQLDDSQYTPQIEDSEDLSHEPVNISENLKENVPNTRAEGDIKILIEPKDELKCLVPQIRKDVKGSQENANLSRTGPECSVTEFIGSCDNLPSAAAEIKSNQPFKESIASDLVNEPKESLLDTTLEDDRKESVQTSLINSSNEALSEHVSTKSMEPESTSSVVNECECPQSTTAQVDISVEISVDYVPEGEQIVSQLANPVEHDEENSNRERLIITSVKLQSPPITVKVFGPESTTSEIYGGEEISTKLSTSNEDTMQEPAQANLIKGREGVQSHTLQSDKREICEYIRMSELNTEDTTDAESVAQSISENEGHKETLGESRLGTTFEDTTISMEGLTAATLVRSDIPTELNDSELNTESTDAALVECCDKTPISEFEENKISTLDITVQDSIKEPCKENSVEISQELRTESQVETDDEISKDTSEIQGQCTQESSSYDDLVSSTSVIEGSDDEIPKNDPKETLASLVKLSDELRSTTPQVKVGDEISDECIKSESKGPEDSQSSEDDNCKIPISSISEESEDLLHNTVVEYTEKEHESCNDVGYTKPQFAAGAEDNSEVEHNQAMSIECVEDLQSTTNISTQGSLIEAFDKLDCTVKSETKRDDIQDIMLTSNTLSQASLIETFAELKCATQQIVSDGGSSDEFGISQRNEENTQEVLMECVDLQSTINKSTQESLIEAFEELECTTSEVVIHDHVSEEKISKDSEKDVEIIAEVSSRIPGTTQVILEDSSQELHTTVQSCETILPDNRIADNMIIKPEVSIVQCDELLSTIPQVSNVVSDAQNVLDLTDESQTDRSVSREEPTTVTINETMNTSKEEILEHLKGTTPPIEDIDGVSEGVNSRYEKETGNTREVTNTVTGNLNIPETSDKIYTESSAVDGNEISNETLENSTPSDSLQITSVEMQSNGTNMNVLPKKEASSLQNSIDEIFDEQVDDTSEKVDEEPFTVVNMENFKPISETVKQDSDTESSQTTFTGAVHPQIQASEQSETSAKLEAELSVKEEADSKVNVLTSAQEILKETSDSYMHGSEVIEATSDVSDMLDRELEGKKNDQAVVQDSSDSQMKIKEEHVSAVPDKLPKEEPPVKSVLAQVMFTEPADSQILIKSLHEQFDADSAEFNEPLVQADTVTDEFNRESSVEREPQEAVKDACGSQMQITAKHDELLEENELSDMQIQIPEQSNVDSDKVNQEPSVQADTVCDVLNRESSVERQAQAALKDACDSQMQITEQHEKHSDAFSNHLNKEAPSEDSKAEDSKPVFEADLTRGIFIDPSDSQMQSTELIVQADIASDELDRESSVEIQAQVAVKNASGSQMQFIGQNEEPSDALADKLHWDSQIQSSKQHEEQIDADSDKANEGTSAISDKLRKEKPGERETEHRELVSETDLAEIVLVDCSDSQNKNRHIREEQSDADSNELNKQPSVQADPEETKQTSVENSITAVLTDASGSPLHQIEEFISPRDAGSDYIHRELPVKTNSEGPKDYSGKLEKEPPNETEDANVEQVTETVELSNVTCEKLSKEPLVESVVEHFSKQDSVQDSSNSLAHDSINKLNVFSENVDEKTPVETKIVIFAKVSETAIHKNESSEEQIQAPDENSSFERGLDKNEQVSETYPENLDSNQQEERKIEKLLHTSKTSSSQEIITVITDSSEKEDRKSAGQNEIEKHAQGTELDSAQPPVAITETATLIQDSVADTTNEIIVVDAESEFSQATETNEALSRDIHVNSELVHRDTSVETTVKSVKQIPDKCQKLDEICEDSCKNTEVSTGAEEVDKPVSSETKNKTRGKKRAKRRHSQNTEDIQPSQMAKIRNVVAEVEKNSGFRHIISKHHEDEEEIVPKLALDSDEGDIQPSQMAKIRKIVAEVEKNAGFRQITSKHHEDEEESVPKLALDSDEGDSTENEYASLVDNENIDDSKVLDVDEQENLETLLAVASLQTMEAAEYDEPELSENEKVEMEALRMAVESITESPADLYDDEDNADRVKNEVGLIKNIYINEDNPVEELASSSAVIDESKNLRIQSVQKVEDVSEMEKLVIESSAPININKSDGILKPQESTGEMENLREQLEETNTGSDKNIEDAQVINSATDESSIQKSENAEGSSETIKESLKESLNTESKENSVNKTAVEFVKDVNISEEALISTKITEMEHESDLLEKGAKGGSKRKSDVLESHGLGKEPSENSNLLEAAIEVPAGTPIDKEKNFIQKPIDTTVSENILMSSKTSVETESPCLNSDSVEHKINEVSLDMPHIDASTSLTQQKAMKDGKELEDIAGSSESKCHEQELISEKSRTKSEADSVCLRDIDNKNVQELTNDEAEIIAKVNKSNIIEPQQNASPDSSQVMSENDEAKIHSTTKGRESKGKANERSRRHKKLLGETKLEELIINVDVPDRDKPYSPKIIIKPIKVPDEEVSTTSNSDTEVTKGSLRMTITKQSDKMHSILKICEQDNCEATQESEEPIPKLIIKPKHVEQHSPKMSTRSSKQPTSTTTQQTGSPRKIKTKTEKSESVSPLKIKIGLKSDESVKKVNPKHNIRLVSKPEEELPRKVTIKSIAKPSEDPENIPSSKRVPKKSEVKPAEAGENNVSLKKATKRLAGKPAEGVEDSPNSRKMPKKLVVKTTEEVEQLHSPRITIKPIPIPEVEKDSASTIHRLNIKPIKQQNNDENEQVKELPNPKITIKPVIKPQDTEPQFEDAEEEQKERIVLKINKGNLPSPKDSKKREHPPTDDEKSSKLAKITVKFSKEGGHHIVHQTEGKRVQDEQTLPTEKNKKQKAEVESIISTRSRYKELAADSSVETRSKHKDQAETSEVAKLKSKDTESPKPKHKNPMSESPIEVKKPKLSDTLVCSLTRSKSKEPIVETHKIKLTQKESDNNVNIIPDKADSPIVISDDSMSQYDVTQEEKDPLETTSEFEITPDSSRLSSKSESASSTPTSLTPRKRGRPRKVPIEVREDFKEQDLSPKLKEDESTQSAYEGRPKRSCRGQSVRDTLGIKPRKPRAPGGKKVAGDTRSVPMKPKKEPKLTKAKLKLMHDEALREKILRRKIEQNPRDVEKLGKSQVVHNPHTKLEKDLEIIEEIVPKAATSKAEHNPLIKLDKNLVVSVEIPSSSVVKRELQEVKKETRNKGVPIETPLIPKVHSGNEEKKSGKEVNTKGAFAILKEPVIVERELANIGKESSITKEKIVATENTEVELKEKSADVEQKAVNVENKDFVIETKEPSVIKSVDKKAVILKKLLIREKPINTGTGTKKHAATVEKAFKDAIKPVKVPQNPTTGPAAVKCEPEFVKKESAVVENRPRTIETEVTNPGNKTVMIERQPETAKERKPVSVESVIVEEKLLKAGQLSEVTKEEIQSLDINKDSKVVNIGYVPLDENYGRKTPVALERLSQNSEKTLVAVGEKLLDAEITSPEKNDQILIPAVITSHTPSAVLESLLASSDSQQAMPVSASPVPKSAELGTIEVQATGLVPMPVSAAASETSSTGLPDEIDIVDEETRMSSDANSRVQTPAKQMIATAESAIEESPSSVQSIVATECSKVPRPSKAPRLEVQEPENSALLADQLTEYYWNGNGPFMLQEQVAQFLGIKSFKRKYPGIKRRMLEMQERDYIRESGLASEHMCNLGLTAVNSNDILDIMYSDFQDKYEEYCKNQRDRQAKELIDKQRLLSLATSQEKSKADMTEQSIRSAALWNAKFNKTRKEQRKACMDLQTFTIHYPKGKMKQIDKPKVGNYPVALVPGQYTDHYQEFSPTEVNNLPINTLCYDTINIIPPPPPPPPPPQLSDDSGSEGSDSDSDSSSSSSGSDSGSSSGVEDCKLCKHSPKKVATK